MSRKIKCWNPRPCQFFYEPMNIVRLLEESMSFSFFFAADVLKFMQAQVYFFAV